MCVSKQIANKIFSHLIIGGSRGRRQCAPPQEDPVFLFLHTFFADKHPRQRSAPPNGSVPPPPQQEILDPPLLIDVSIDI